MARSSTPLIVAFCPNAPSALLNPEACKLFAEIEQQIIAALDQIPNLYLVDPRRISQISGRSSLRPATGPTRSYPLYVALLRRLGNDSGSEDSCSYESAL